MNFKIGVFDDVCHKFVFAVLCDIKPFDRDRWEPGTMKASSVTSLCSSVLNLIIFYHDLNLLMEDEPLLR